VILVYVQSQWAETGLSTIQKVSFLNNLETMYTEAVSYIDSLTHSSIYYDESTCDSTFFSSVTDGSGSGLIAATLDGYSAEDIIAAGSPSGVIGIWSGSEASIPSGWYLCNGQKMPTDVYTPDLRGRFIVGAGSHYSRGDTGGADTVTSAAIITIAGHALTASEIPLHTHGSIVDHYNPDGGSTPDPAGSTETSDRYNAGGLSDHTGYTGYAGSGAAHSHTAIYSGTADQDKRPEYYALCFIMKS
jgi:microcystin-dependent protein